MSPPPAHPHTQCAHLSTAASICPCIPNLTRGRKRWPSRAPVGRERHANGPILVVQRSARDRRDLSSISARSLGKEVRGGTAARSGSRDEPQTQGGGCYMPHVHTPACRTHPHVAHPHVAHTRMLHISACSAHGPFGGNGRPSDGSPAPTRGPHLVRGSVCTESASYAAPTHSVGVPSADTRPNLPRASAGYI